MKVAAKIVVVVLGLASVLRAQGISGTVLNATLRTPAAGDEVLLLRYGQGLQQVARTTTDANGRFNFTRTVAGPYAVRVIHDGQVYDREPHPGAKAVNLEVFDIASEVKQISTALVLAGLQAHDDALEIVELHFLQNTSDPPRVWQSANGFETPLPAGAELEWARGMAAGQRPVNISPVRIGNSNSYRLNFPLRPGQTRLQFAYRLKYSGSTTVSLRFPSRVTSLGIVVPAGLHFTAGDSLRFQRVTETGAEVQMISGVSPGQIVTFHVSGKPSATTALQEKIVSGTPPVQTSPSALADARRAGAAERLKDPAQTPGRQHNANILTAFLVTVAIVIVLLRMVLPRLSVARRFRAAIHNKTPARRRIVGNASSRADCIDHSLVKRANL